MYSYICSISRNDVTTCNYVTMCDVTLHHQCNMSQGLAGGISPSTPIRIQLPGSNFTLTVPGILASQLATSQALAAAAANQQHQLSSQESSESQKGNSQEFSIGL